VIQSGVVLHNLDLDTLMALVERKAMLEADGHLTLLRFTTGWKCMIGTPELRYGDEGTQVADLIAHASLKEALTAFLLLEEKQS
jgi:hypothetical protein